MVYFYKVKQMFNKVYEKIKEFIKENYLGLLFYLVFVATLMYPLPYYIYTGGGCMNTKNRVQVENEYPADGSFYFAYVSQLQATIPGYLLAHVIPGWEIESIENYQTDSDETQEELLLRDHLYLEEANTAAIFNAYQKAAKEIQVQEKNHYIIYLQDRTKTNLKIGDKIEKINGETVEDLEQIRGIVDDIEVGEKISFEVIRNQKKVSCYAEVYEEEHKKFVGISIVTLYDYELDPSLKLSFNRKESGPSGGLTLALTIYNQLVPEDITKGKKIVGTGTIAMDGTVGEIGGVAYKLQGAVAEKADVFLVPNGNNYKEALQIQKKKGYDINIIGVDSFEDAIEKLRQLKN